MKFCKTFAILSRFSWYLIYISLQTPPSSPTPSRIKIYCITFFTFRTEMQLTTTNERLSSGITKAFSGLCW